MGRNRLNSDHNRVTKPLTSKSTSLNKPIESEITLLYLLYDYRKYTLPLSTSIYSDRPVRVDKADQDKDCNDVDLIVRQSKVIYDFYSKQDALRQHIVRPVSSEIKKYLTWRRAKKVPRLLSDLWFVWNTFMCLLSAKNAKDNRWWSSIRQSLTSRRI